MKLSIVTTLYNSGKTLETFCQQCIEQVEKITSDYELILVHDGSPDNSLEISLSLRKKNPRIIVIDLSRNFGEHKARMTGLTHARGDYIFLIQCDLEVSPACLAEFWQEMQALPEHDMIFGIRKDARGSFSEELQRKIFYRVFNRISSIPYHHQEAGCRLMTRRFVNALVAHRERTLSFMGLCSHTGFSQKSQLVSKERHCPSSYSLAKKAAIAVDATTSYSAAPLVFSFYVGCGISLIAFVYGIFLIAKQFFNEIAISGWTSLMVSIWFLGGMILAAIGMVGIYLSRIFLEVKQRPYTIIRQIYGDESN